MFVLRTRPSRAIPPVSLVYGDEVMTHYEGHEGIAIFRNSGHPCAKVKFLFTTPVLKSCGFKLKRGIKAMKSRRFCFDIL